MYIKNLKQKIIRDERPNNSFGKITTVENYYVFDNIKENILCTRETIESSKDFSIRLNGKEHIIPKSVFTEYDVSVSYNHEKEKSPKTFSINIYNKEKIVEVIKYYFDENNVIQKYSNEKYYNGENEKYNKEENKYSYKGIIKTFDDKGNMINFKEYYRSDDENCDDINIVKELVFDIKYNSIGLIDTINIIDRANPADIKYIKQYIYDENNNLSDIMVFYMRIVNKHVLPVKLELEHVLFEYDLDDRLCYKEIYEYQDDYINHPLEIFEERLPNNVNAGKNIVDYYYYPEYNQEIWINKRSAREDTYVFPKDKKGRIVSKLHYRNSKLIDSEEYYY